MIESAIVTGILGIVILQNIYVQRKISKIEQFLKGCEFRSKRGLEYR